MLDVIFLGAIRICGDDKVALPNEYLSYLVAAEVCTGFRMLTCSIGEHYASVIFVTEF